MVDTLVEVKKVEDVVAPRRHRETFHMFVVDARATNGRNKKKQINRGKKIKKNKKNRQHTVFVIPSVNLTMVIPRPPFAGFHSGINVYTSFAAEASEFAGLYERGSMGSSSIFARTVRVGLVDMFEWNSCFFFFCWDMGICRGFTSYGGSGIC